MARLGTKSLSWRGQWKQNLISGTCKNISTLHIKWVVGPSMKTSGRLVCSSVWYADDMITYNFLSKLLPGCLCRQRAFWPGSREHMHQTGWQLTFKSANNFKTAKIKVTFISVSCSETQHHQDFFSNALFVKQYFMKQLSLWDNYSVVQAEQQNKAQYITVAFQPNITVKWRNLHIVQWHLQKNKTWFNLRQFFFLCWITSSKGQSLRQCGLSTTTGHVCTNTCVDRYFTFSNSSW